MKNIFKIWKERYLQVDKALHFLVGLIIAENSVFIFGWEYALIILFVAGLGKEIWDSRKSGSGFDFFDLWATVTGGLVGTSIGAIIMQTINN